MTWTVILFLGGGEAFLSFTTTLSNKETVTLLPFSDLLKRYAKEKLGWTKVKTDELLLPVLQKLKDTQVCRGLK